MEKADGCKLLLPFAINSNGLAKLGDGTVMEDWRKNDGLYQSGKEMITWDEHISDDILRLKLLFKN
jgi:hypothetical protein